MKNLQNSIDWQKCGNLLPAIIQDAKTLEVLMLGFLNPQALNLTIETKKVHFWSRTKGRIWMKGEQSGNILNVVDTIVDCDNDSLLILVNPVGNTCHNGTKSCFNTRTNFVAELEEFIITRTQKPENDSYINALQAKGINKIAQKVGEEAVETVIASLKESDENLIGECADLLFHLLILLNARKLSLNDIIEKLKSRDKRKMPS